MEAKQRGNNNSNDKYFGSDKSTKNVKCYYCGKFVYIKNDCRKGLWDE